MAERNVRFVQIFHRGWDQHANVPGDLPDQCRDIDQPSYALIQDLKLRLTVNYQDREVFIGESMSDQPDTEPVPVWGAIRSTGKEGVFVTANGGRGNIWFTSANQFEYCFANQTQEQMSSYCAVLKKQP